MSSWIQFLLLGLAVGAAYSVIGVSVVVTFRASGVVNFAAGAIALLAAYWFNTMRTSGALVLPVGTIQLGDQSFVSALLITIALSALLGLLIYAVVMRPLRHASPLAQVAVSVALMSGLQALVLIRFGSTAPTVPAIFSAGTFTLLGATAPTVNLWLTALALVAALVVWGIYRFTRFGLATRAAAENERAAAFLGFAPTRIAALNWVLAAVLAGAAGIFVAPVSNLDATGLVLIIVPVLAAALLGRLTSIWTVTIAGLAIGMLQSTMIKLQTDVSWLSQVGVSDAFPFLVVIGAVLIMGGKVPARGQAMVTRLPAALEPRRVWASSALALAVGAVAMVVLTGSYRAALMLSLVYTAVALSVVLVSGYIGQISLAQVTLAGIGGLGLSKLAVSAGIPFPLAPLLASLLAAAVGVAIGVAALRVRGVSLAIVTLGAAVAITSVVFASPSLTDGDAAPIPAVHIFGLNLAISGSGYPRVAFGLFLVVVVTAIGVVVANLRRSATGRRFLAVRSNERAAEAIGIKLWSTKLIAFGISAFIAGLGGCLWGYQSSVLAADTFAPLLGVSLLVFVYVGGLGSIYGALVAGLLFPGGLLAVVLNNLIGLGEYEVLIGAGLLILTAILNPDGIAGATNLQLQAASKWLRPRLPARQPAADQDAPIARVPVRKGPA